MKAKMTKNFENIKVKLSLKEAQKLHKELEHICEGDYEIYKTYYPELDNLVKILCKTKPITNNDEI